MKSIDAKAGRGRRLVERAQLAVRLIRRPSRGGARRMARRLAFILGAVFLAVFLLTLALLDVRAVNAARELPPAFIAITRHFTDLGKAGIFLYPLPLLMIALCFAPVGLSRAAKGTLSALFARVAFVFFAIGIPYWINGVLKQVLGRARPFVGGHDSPYSFEPFSWGSAYASLPSGHAVTVSAAAVAIGALFPRARVVMWLYAVLIVISRIVVTAHHPSDVMAGALVGTIGALIVRNYFASRRIVFGVTPDGAVEPFAGPSARRIKMAIREIVGRA
jgi:undecaprenyl-diphosphatase